MIEIDYEKARKMALDFVNSSYTEADDELLIVDEHTIEKEYGWYFFYNTRSFLDSGDHRYRLAGNGPVLVTKRFGKIVQFGTAHPVEHYIQLYESGSWPE